MKIDCVIIGAGVIGLACARRFALAGHEVIILEAQDAIGTETSSRNSEVIHAGIYYPKGSLKARLCLEGKYKLYDYCKTHHIEHQKIGKLIVATEASEVPRLSEIYDKAAQNGVNDLYYLDQSEIQQLEPQLKVVRGLYSPSTGIIDSHAFMLSLLGEAEKHGAMLAVKSRVNLARVTSEGIRLSISCDNDRAEDLLAKIVINSAGLEAPTLAKKIEGLDPHFCPTAFYCKGTYFCLTGLGTPFKHLVYPVPNSAGLGVHVTLDLAGQTRFGPDTEWVDAPNYEIDIRRGEKFYAAIRQYWPGLEDNALQPGYIGIRPKIVGPNQPAGDFIISGPSEHHVPGLVNLFGIESPGLTASLAIADQVYFKIHPKKNTLTENPQLSPNFV